MSSTLGKVRYETPSILFLIFNRPDLVERTFETIRVLRPKLLYIAADGPRHEHSGELELCQLSRQMTESVDWDCEVQRLYRDTNLGCREAVRSAITWFFEHVEEGIILEDDVLPDASFFPFCGELLERYRSDERVMAICGESYGPPAFWETKPSYLLSGCPLIWGWATWRRAWNQHCDAMTGLEDTLSSNWLLDYHGNPRAAEHWQNELRATQLGQIDTWDYRWFNSVWQNHGLCAMPNRNLISNIGCDPRATHTTSEGWKLANRPSYSLDFPIQHPVHVNRNYQLDNYIHAERFGLDAESRVPTAELAKDVVANVGTILRRAIDRSKFIKRRT